MKKAAALLGLILLLTGCKSEGEVPNTQETEIATTEEVEAFEEAPLQTAEAEDAILGSDSKLYKYYQEHYLDKDYMYTLRSTVEGNGIITESVSTTAELGDMLYLSKEDDLSHLSQIARDGNIYVLNHDTKTMEIYPQEGPISATEDALTSIANLQIFEGKGTFFDKEYDTEWFEFMGTQTTYFFDGDALIGYEQRSPQGVVYTELIEETHDVDESLFVVPDNYKIEVQTGEAGQ